MKSFLYSTNQKALKFFFFLNPSHKNITFLYILWKEQLQFDWMRFSIKFSLNMKYRLEELCYILEQIGKNKYDFYWIRPNKNGTFNTTRDPFTPYL